MVLLRTWLCLFGTFVSISIMHIHETSEIQEFMIWGRKRELRLTLPERILVAARLSSALAAAMLDMSALSSLVYMHAYVRGDLLFEFGVAVDHFATGHQIETLRKDLLYVLFNFDEDRHFQRYKK